MGELAQVENLSFDQKHLRIHWADDHTSVYDALWLRDNCPADRDARNGQRLIDIADLPADPSIGAVSHNSDSAILITWSGEPKSSWFPLAWLRDQCYCDAHRLSRNRPPVLWQADRNSEFLWMDYHGVLDSRQARAQWLRALADYGIAFLRGVPCQDGQVLEVARLIGYVRETNYGKVFDVRSVPNPNNLAYSDLALGLHTDNPYRDPVPGLQILHCIQASDEGGDSLFADGFGLARHLTTQQPEAFEILSRVPAPFIFCDDSAQLRAERCLLELSASGELAAVHYNNRSIAPLCLPPEELIAFYRAYRAFALLLRAPQFAFRIKLQNGDLVAFNNRRVLHGRTAFAAAGPRWLQGCYVDSDGMLSNLAVLETKRALSA